MGEVYRAKDTRLDRSVAVKILPSEFAHNEQLKQRFEREAKTISQLNHPHICTLYDVGHDNGIDYLVMELIEGESLADRISRGPLPMQDVLRYGIQIAEALDRAHKQGIVHRDLKPANVMLTKSGAKLLDFGLAKSAVIVAAPESATIQRSLTAEGSIVGTFHYMSPEQLEGLEATACTDIFALGLVLYEMGTGRRAFDGKTKTSLIAAIVSAQPTPISQIQPLTPPVFEHIVNRCLEKDPEDRWRSAKDVAEELKWISGLGSQAGVAAPSITRRASRERFAWIAAVVLAAAGAAVATYRSTKTQPQPNYRFIIPMIDRDYRNGTTAIISHNGRKIAFRAARTNGVGQIYVRSLDDFAVRALPGTDGAVLYCWSPDDRSLLISVDGKLCRVDIDGNAAPDAIADGVPDTAAWGSAGVILVGNDEGPLQKIPATGGQAVAITRLDPSKFERGHRAPVFLPDGKRFLFTTFTRDPAHVDAMKTLYAGSLDSPQIKKIADISSMVRYARGFLFFVRSGTLYAQRFDQKTLSLSGEPVVVASDVTYFQPTGTAGFSVSDDGTIVCQAIAQPTQLTIVDRQGRPTATVGPLGSIASVYVTADATHAVVARTDPQIGTPDLWNYGLARETATRLTFDSSWENHPVVSRDGTKLYYASDAAGVPDMYERSFDGSEPPRRVLAEAGDQYPTDISPDGKYLLYQTAQDWLATREDIYALPLAGGKPLPVVRTPAGERSARFSPDGKWIAFASTASGRMEVYVKPFMEPGAARQISIRGGRSPRWSADGQHLYFMTDHELFVADLAGGEPKVLFRQDARIGVINPLPNDRFLLALTNDIDASSPARVIVRWPDTVGK